MSIAPLSFLITASAIVESFKPAAGLHHAGEDDRDEQDQADILDGALPTRLAHRPRQRGVRAALPGVDPLHLPTSRSFVVCERRMLGRGTERIYAHWLRICAGGVTASRAPVLPLDSSPVRALVVTNIWPTTDAPQRGIFVADQVAALRRHADVEIDVLAFPPGARALVRATLSARRRTGGARYDVVHAHFGLAAWPALPRAAGRWS